MIFNVTKDTDLIRMSDTDFDSEEMAGSRENQYCSILETMELIHQPFDHEKRQLEDFIDIVANTLEVGRPKPHGLLLKYMKTKIAGRARCKFLVQDLPSAWYRIKHILAEN